jgi:hypothetical protein
MPTLRVRGTGKIPDLEPADQLFCTRLQELVDARFRVLCGIEPERLSACNLPPETDRPVMRALTRMLGRGRIITMAPRTHTAEQIVRKPREADRLLAAAAAVVVSQLDLFDARIRRYPGV